MTKNIFSGSISHSISWGDHFSIGISMLCLAHCLLMPILLVTIPTLNASLLGNENFHAFLVYMVIPSSIFALILGCKQHSRRSFMIIGVCGLSLLILGVYADALGLNHSWEQRFTVLGSLCIAFAHLRNFQLCHKSKNCECH